MKLEEQEETMNNILLEAGRGEVEVVEFLVGSRHYAINVLKIKGIVQIDEITALPSAPEEVAGLTEVRGELNTVIDLKVVLHKQKSEDYSKTLGLLCEFNDTIIIFLVEHVVGIRRVKWSDIKQNNQIQEETLAIGTILIENIITVLLDFEAITIAAKIGKGYTEQSTLQIKGEARHKKIILVEDSRAIGEMSRCALMESGYENVKLFENGQEVKDYLTDLRDNYGEDFKDHVHLVVTDIEMPIMDGYTLTRWIKGDPMLQQIPVIIFSSLISRDLEHKGEEVGADIQISKPSIKELVRIVTKILG